MVPGKNDPEMSDTQSDKKGFCMCIQLVKSNQKKQMHNICPRISCKNVFHEISCDHDFQHLGVNDLIAPNNRVASSARSCL